MRSFDTLSVLACLPGACLEMQLKIKTGVARSPQCPRRLVCEDAVISTWWLDFLLLLWMLPKNDLQLDLYFADVTGERDYQKTFT